MSNKTFWVKYGKTKAVEIGKHLKKDEPFENVSDLIQVVKGVLITSLGSYDLNQLSLHLPAGINRSLTDLDDDCFDEDIDKTAIADDCLLSRLLDRRIGTGRKNPLIIKAINDVMTDKAETLRIVDSNRYIGKIQGTQSKFALYPEALSSFESLKNCALQYVSSLKTNQFKRGLFVFALADKAVNYVLLKNETDFSNFKRNNRNAIFKFSSLSETPTKKDSDENLNLSCLQMNVNRLLVLSDMKELWSSDMLPTIILDMFIERLVERGSKTIIFLDEIQFCPQLAELLILKISRLAAKNIFKVKLVMTGTPATGAVYSIKFDPNIHSKILKTITVPALNGPEFISLVKALDLNLTLNEIIYLWTFSGGILRFLRLWINEIRLGSSIEQLVYRDMTHGFHYLDGFGNQEKKYLFDIAKRRLKDYSDEYDNLIRMGVLKYAIPVSKHHVRKVVVKDLRTFCLVRCYNKEKVDLQALAGIGFEKLVSSYFDVILNSTGILPKLNGVDLTHYRVMPYVFGQNDIDLVLMNDTHEYSKCDLVVFTMKINPKSFTNESLKAFVNVNVVKFLETLRNEVKIKSVRVVSCSPSFCVDGNAGIVDLYENILLLTQLAVKDVKIEDIEWYASAWSFESIEKIAPYVNSVRQDEWIVLERTLNFQDEIVKTRSETILISGMRGVGKTSLISNIIDTVKSPDFKYLQLES